ncbi:M-phase inducer phosphatase [Halotydeus destructor]|nr:M-phase inducer phosphatase [Halotydeus destructor]
MSNPRSFRKSTSLDLTPMRNVRESLSDSFELKTNLNDLSATEENSCFGGLKRHDRVELPDTPTLGSYAIKKRKPSPLDRLAFRNSLGDQLTPVRGLSERRSQNSATDNKLLSENEAVIKDAVHKYDTQPDLIGDCSRIHALPLISGKHQDLKSIGPDTLAALMNGQFDDTVDSFQVIDCRYPYEYDGGHIGGAINLYTKEELMKKYFNSDNCHENTENDQEKRKVLIFHCEFSSERGPSLLRFLRKKDRELNQNMYPKLNHPELYILNGGYKAFYEKFQDLCEPCSYTPMTADKEACCRFRQKSKSCNGESKWTNQSRNCLKF